MRTRLVLTAAAAALLTVSVVPQGGRPAQVTSPRIYVFDNGSIRGLDTKLFGFEKNDVKEPNFTVQSYLIGHPRGTLMWDTAVVPHASFKPDGTAGEGVSTA